MDEIVGQEFTVRTLRNSLKSGKIAHAYLFCGPRGVGKTSLARILAKSVNCETGITPTPCQVCVSCKSITEGTSLDVIEIDAASNRGVDDIRQLRDHVKFAPVSSRFKVYIIDEVHMLTGEAFNALLKTLEEPPSHIIFILATTEPHKIPVTILSRCMRFDLKRIPTDMQVTLLRRIADAEKIDITDDALRMLAIDSNGSLRDAESLLDQVASFSEGRIQGEDIASMLGVMGEKFLHALMMKIGQVSPKGAIELVRASYRDGKEPEQMARDLLLRIHVIILSQLGLPKEELLSDYAVDSDLIKEEGAIISFETLRAIELKLRDLVSQMRYAFSSLALFEMAILELIDMVTGNTFEVKPLKTQEPQKTVKVEPIETHKTKVEQVPKPKSEPKPEPVSVIPQAPVSEFTNRIKEIVKTSDIILYAFVMCLLDAIEDDSLVTLTLPSDAEFSKNRLSEPVNSQKLRDIISKLLGHEVQVKVQLQKTTKGNIADDEQVKNAASLFGGTIEVKNE